MENVVSHRVFMRRSPDSVGPTKPDGDLARIAVTDKEALRIRCYFLLAISDTIAMAGAFLGANLIYLRDIYSIHGVTMLTSVLPIYLVLAAIGNAYNGAVLARARTGIWRATQAFLMAAATVLFVAYFLKAGSEFSRLVFALGGLGAIALITVFRLTLRTPMLRTLGGNPLAVVVIRDGVDYKSVASEVVLTPQAIGFDPDTSDPHLYDAFATSVADADRLIIACPQNRYLAWSKVLRGLSIGGEILTDEDDHLGIRGISRYGERRTMVVSIEPLHLRQRLAKRAFDLAVAIPLSLLLLPVFVITAIAICLESAGPVLFVQPRIGRDNRIFRMVKFRSMYTDQCDSNAATLTSRNDARVTRVGEFIRRTSIDELPQLLNVLLGDMSIVGPRPHAILAKAADKLYWDADIRYRYRHSIKPGLTGLAQVRGFRGATDRVEDLTNRLSADLEYLQNWSVAQDFWILMRTLRVLRHSNAF